MRNLVTALVAALAFTAASAAGAAAQGNPPNLTVYPTITGQPAAGAVLTASTGTWSGDQPITFTYQWTRCTFTLVGGEITLNGCGPIPGATQSTYTVAPTDTGTSLNVVVTATNAAGSDWANALPAVAIDPVSDLPDEPRIFALPGAVPSVPWMLARGGVTGYYRAPRAGRLVISWTASVGGRTVVIARATARFPHRGRYKVRTVLTKQGRAAYAANYLLPVYIAGEFIPSTGPLAGTPTSTATGGPITF